MSSDIELISSTTPSALDLLPVLKPEFVAGESANDTDAWITRERDVNDINLLVSRVTELVAKHADSVTFELDLCPSVPDIAPNLDTLAFALSAIVVNQLGTLDDLEESVSRIVRVGTHVSERSVSISILANGIPQLAAVRAIDEDNAPDCDRLIRHCRELIENSGGWIDLDEDQNFLGFEVHLPASPLTHSTSLRGSAPANEPHLAHAICMAS